MAEYRNNTPMAEKERIVRNDHTMHSRASADLELERNRYSQPQTVTGANSTVDYPRIPGGPWAPDYSQVPPEPPYGEDIGQAPIVGEAHEIEKALAAASADVEGGAANRECGASSSDPLATPSQSSFADDVRGPGAALPIPEATLGMGQSQPAEAAPSPKRRRL